MRISILLMLVYSIFRPGNKGTEGLDFLVICTSILRLLPPWIHLFMNSISFHSIPRNSLDISIAFTISSSAMELLQITSFSLGVRLLAVVCSWYAVMDLS